RRAVGDVGGLADEHKEGGLKGVLGVLMGEGPPANAPHHRAMTTDQRSQGVGVPAANECIQQRLVRIAVPIRGHGGAELLHALRHRAAHRPAPGHCSVYTTTSPKSGWLMREKCLSSDEQPPRLATAPRRRPQQGHACGDEAEVYWMGLVAELRGGADEVGDVP